MLVDTCKHPSYNATLVLGSYEANITYVGSCPNEFINNYVDTYKHPSYNATLVLGSTLAIINYFG